MRGGIKYKKQEVNILREGKFKLFPDY